MKKSIIALAVLAAGFAQADGTTLYGEAKSTYTFDTGASSLKNFGKNVAKGKKTESTSAFDLGGKFGIKGSDDLGNGVSAFYKFETKVGQGFGAKKAFAGVKGGFGSVSIGNQNAPRDGLSNFSDPTNQFEANVGRAAFTSMSNSLVYTTPEMSGFSAGAAISAKSAGMKGDVNRHVDAVDVLAKYEANGIYAGVGYQQLLTDKDLVAKNTPEGKNIGLGFGYGNDMFNAGVLVEKALGEDGAAEPMFVRLGGAYNFTNTDSVYGSVSYLDKDQKGTDPQIAATIGYEHNFSKHTKAWAEYGFVGESAKKADDDSNKFGLGLKTTF